MLMARFGLIIGVALLATDAVAQTWNCTNVLDWNFFSANVTENNLGGLGPNFEAPEL